MSAGFGNVTPQLRSRHCDSLGTEPKSAAYCINAQHITLWSTDSAGAIGILSVPAAVLRGISVPALARYSVLVSPQCVKA